MRRGEVTLKGGGLDRSQRKTRQQQRPAGQGLTIGGERCATCRANLIGQTRDPGRAESQRNLFCFQPTLLLARSEALASRGFPTRRSLLRRPLPRGLLRALLRYHGLSSLADQGRERLL